MPKQLLDYDSKTKDYFAMFSREYGIAIQQENEGKILAKSSIVFAIKRTLQHFLDNTWGFGAGRDHYDLVKSVAQDIHLESDDALVVFERVAQMVVDASQTKEGIKADSHFAGLCRAITFGCLHWKEMEVLTEAKTFRSMTMKHSDSLHSLLGLDTHDGRPATKKVVETDSDSDNDEPLVSRRRPGIGNTN